MQPTRASLCVTNTHPTKELSLAKGGGFELRWSSGVLKEGTTKAVLRSVRARYKVKVSKLVVPKCAQYHEDRTNVLPHINHDDVCFIITLAEIM